MSLSGEFLAVIFRVVRGLDGELIDSFRARLLLPSLSERERA